MSEYLQLAKENQEKARNIIQKIEIVPAWESIGAKVNLVGSLSTGLLMTHLDIDFHIYSAPLKIADSFEAVKKLAECPGVEHIWYNNLINTEEECIEWHINYRNDDGNLWQIDMIHILAGSRYDGYFERMAQRINEIITRQQHQTILKLKYETPAIQKIPGVLYYQAVIRDGISNFESFTEWMKNNPTDGIIEWIP